MEENQILKELNKNLYDMETVENEISMVEVAIYQKSIEELEHKKENEIREFFEQKAKFYNQKIEKYNYEVNDYIEKCKTQIKKLTNTYDELYMNVFKIMQNAINNQKIAIANIVTLKEQLKKENLKDKKLEETKNKMIACAEKKLNYAVIVEECKARIKWCIENVQNDINEIFTTNNYQLEICDENILNRIRRSFYNIIFGKSNYKKFLVDYKKEYLKSIKAKNNTKILDVVSTIKGIIKQMEDTNKQILAKYNERLCA